MTQIVHELDLPEVDLFGADRDTARAKLAAARQQHWLARMPLGYSVTRYEDVVAILRDRRFHSALGMLATMSGVSDPDLSARQQRSILGMEGDEHARLRRLVAPAFTPKAADRLRPFMRSVVTGLADAVVPEGRCEFVRDICEPYPIPIICELLGAPKEDWKLFSAWATDIFRIFNGDIAGDLDKIKAAMTELDGYVRAMITERRSRPADDLLSAMIAAEEAGDRLSTDELVMMTEAVLMAGTDTTRNQLACAVAVYTEHPEQWRALADDPGLAPRAVEESLRFLGAVRGTARIASEDIEYRDVVFPAGTLVAVSLASANFDPDVVPGDPEVFESTRQMAVPQMTLGAGIHHCLGANLARAELEEALAFLAPRMPGLRLTQEPEFGTVQGIYGLESLHLAWD